MLLGVEGVRQFGADLLFEVVVVRLIELWRLDLALRFADFVAQFVDGLADLLDLGVAEFDGVEHGVFVHFFRARLDHHDAVGGSDDHDVQQALAHLVVGGVHDKRAVDQADAHRADRTEERNVGKRQRRGGAVDAEHVGIIVAVGREDEGDDLRLAAESLGEHGPNRAINLAAGEDFALAHAAFALDEASGETSAGIGVFAVVHSEGEEVDAFAGIGVGDGGGENNVFAEADDGRAVGLFGEFSGFKRDFFAAGEMNGNAGCFWFHD